MKLRSPMHSIDARGRFADALVLGIWRGINWARKMVMPSQPRTPRQITVRGILTSVARAWGTLTPTQRANWEAYAKLVGPSDEQTGNTVHWSGIDAFVNVNTVLVDTGQPLAVDPPALPLPDRVPGYAAAPGPFPGQVTVTWTPLPVGVLVDFWTQDAPASRHLYASKYKHNLYLDGALGTMTFGPLLTGRNFGVEGRQVRPDGGRGPYSVGESIVP